MYGIPSETVTVGPAEPFTRMLTVGVLVADPSETITLKVPVAVLPTESVAVQVTAVVPIEKTDPGGGVQATVTALPLVLVATGSS